MSPVPPSGSPRRGRQRVSYAFCRWFGGPTGDHVMIPRCTLRHGLMHPQLLGAQLGGPSWHGWRALLLAAMGEALRPDELAAFQRLTGRQSPPAERVAEAWFAIGRRGGKSKAIAALAIYLAGLCEHPRLSRGERGIVLCLAGSERQGKVVFDYIAGMLAASPGLGQLLARQTADTLELTNGISIEVRAASYRRLRGLTCVAAICDEIATWHSEDSSNPDTEVLRALRPMLLTTRGMLFVISSPYARRGELWQTHSRHFGEHGDPAILVAQGTSRDLNPELTQAEIDREYERDPVSAAAEYGAAFRSDVEAFVAVEAVRACIDPNVRERPPERHVSYSAFVDPSGGSSDSMVLAICHTEGKQAVLDVIREVRAPFSPGAVVEEFAALLRKYQCWTVRGDKYAAEWCVEAFQQRGISYESEDVASKSELYLNLLPAINSGSVVLLDHSRLEHQLLGLERFAVRGGKDKIDHARGAHDDVANAVAGALVLAHEFSAAMLQHLQRYAIAEFDATATHEENVRTAVIAERRLGWDEPEDRLLRQTHAVN